MLKTTAGLAVAGVIGAGLGYGASELLHPVREVIKTETTTETTTMTQPLIEEQVFQTVTIGGPISVHVRGGKIAWVEPLQYSESEAKPWTMTAGGKSFTPPRRIAPNQIAMASRRKVYAPDRLRYPMKRVGFEPGGKSDVSNRGKGEFVRITWEEAFDIIAKELKRIKETYGNSAITGWTAAHKEWGSLHYGEAFNRFLNCFGGYTERLSDGYSWSGWMYGAPFIWGFAWNQGTGDQDDLMQDLLQNSKLLVFWGTDPTVVEAMYSGHEPSLWRVWAKEVGIRMIAINPIYCDTAAVFCDQWIPIYPGTDIALALAIAYVWINEGTLDQKYLDTHTIGFDKFKDYVLGVAEGPDGKIARTPEWAQKITGIDANTIISLAREWASKPTMLNAYWSGGCRTSYAHEWARAMITLQAMQGLGKPGVGIYSFRYGGPNDPRQKGPPGYVFNFSSVAKNKIPNAIPQRLQYLNFADAILTDFKENPPLKWRGGGWIYTGPTDVFKEYTYPMPGHSEIKMVWRYGASTLNVDAGGDWYARAYKSPKIEFILVQTIYNEPEAMFADILLPINTGLERNDLSEAGQAGRYGPGLSTRVVVYQRKCIEPLYESKTDWEVFTELADRLGFKEQLTEGNSEDDWLRKMYKTSTVPLSWEEFRAKGYYIFELPKDYKPRTALRWYYEKPEGEGLRTPSGKIEIYSQMLADFYGENSNAIGTVPKYFEDPEGRFSPLATKYPLQLDTAHPKFRMHGQWHNVTWLSDLCKYKGYEPVWMNPADAEARGVKENDIVRIFNDRGQTLCYAHATERIRQGVIWVAEGAWYKPAEPGNVDSIDAGGDINVLTSRNPMSPHAYIERVNSTLVQVEKWKG
jgi:trimethylamine-N-oxide reductase (cytochrome c)